MKCEFCEIIDREDKEQIIYEDDEILAVVKDTAVIPGQITIFPKQHFTIMEMVPNDILEKCFLLANKVGISVFEGLEAQGTNIVVQNGLGAGQKTPHFAIEVIPRREGDRLNFQWQPKQLMEDEIELVHSDLKKEAKNIDLTEKKKDEVVVKDEKTEMKVEKMGEDYLVKSLKRMP